MPLSSCTVKIFKQYITKNLYQLLITLAVIFSVGCASYMDHPADSKINVAEVSIRDVENIQQTIDSVKNQIYSHYQAALSKDPDLKGAYEFKLLIKADGTVTNFKLLRSELDNTSLNKSIKEEITKLNFGSINTADTKLKYKFVFFPN